jgi:hypothetical protein
MPRLTSRTLLTKRVTQWQTSPRQNTVQTLSIDLSRAMLCKDEIIVTT